MNVDEWIEYIIVSDKKVALPIMTHPGIELLNKRVLDAVTDGEVHFKAVEALNELSAVGSLYGHYGPDGRGGSFWCTDSV